MGSKIESIGVYRDPTTSGILTIDLIRNAAVSCLRNSKHDRNEIDFIVHVSTYRAKEIVEPAMAVFVQKTLEINHDIESSEGPRTLSFDLMNGSLGFLQGAHVIDSMIASGKAKVGLIVSGNTKSHIGKVVEPSIPFCEIGVAALLDEAAASAAGFSAFYYRGFPEYLANYESYVVFRNLQWFSIGFQSKNIQQIMIESVNAGVTEYLRGQDTDLDSFDIVIPPQISPEFIAKMCAALGGKKERFVDVTENDDDLKTASVPVALKYVIDNGLARPGNRALMVCVGSGVQVACATYTF
jgi:3-oxoacyl-[acyl-carrier-protein] synthase III